MLAALLGLLSACAAPNDSGPVDEAVLPPCARRSMVVVSRSYIVFFDRGSAVITQRGSEIIKEFAATLKDIDHFSTDLWGHTDAAEAKTAAQTLSYERATAVWSAISAENALNGLITPYGYGASRPLVRTKPGVAEPQNRRVELIIRGGQARLAARQECRAWLRVHCLTPNPLKRAGTGVCRRVLDAV